MKSVDLIDSDGEQELVIMYDKFLGDPLVIPRFSKKWYYNCDIDKWGVDGRMPVEHCVYEAFRTAIGNIRGANDNRKLGIQSQYIDFGDRDIEQIDTLINYGLAIDPILGKEYIPLAIQVRTQ